ncbi:Nephrin, partial [Fragariocoptes setiger]
RPVPALVWRRDERLLDATYVTRRTTDLTSSQRSIAQFTVLTDIDTTSAIMNSAGDGLSEHKLSHHKQLLGNPSSEELNSIDKVMPSDQQLTAVNRMHLHQLSRTDAGAQLMCVASNLHYSLAALIKHYQPRSLPPSALSASPQYHSGDLANHSQQQLDWSKKWPIPAGSVHALVTVEMNLRPIDVKIVNPVRILTAGQSTEFSCVSSGSQPPAHITWLKGTQRLSPDSVRQSVSTNVSSSVSRISFIPQADDHELDLVCRAENTRLPESQRHAIEDRRQLTVHYAPRVHLGLGAKISSDAAREGNDIYFECDVSANPSIRELTWTHDGRTLASDPSHGLILTNYSLVLQKVKLSHRGHYQCLASNTEGITESNRIILRVLHAPKCSASEPIIRPVGLHEPTGIECRMDADPPELEFEWYLNNSFNEHKTIGTGHDIRHNLTTSILNYTVDNRQDFGQLYCRARNAIDRDTRPCVFEITQAVAPGALVECHLVNITGTSLTVSCLPGPDGGIKQTFVAEVFQKPATFNYEAFNTSIVNYDEPLFVVHRLQADTDVLVMAYSHNAQGKSEPVYVTAHTLAALDPLEPSLDDSTGHNNNIIPTSQDLATMYDPASTSSFVDSAITTPIQQQQHTNSDNARSMAASPTKVAAGPGPNDTGLIATRSLTTATGSTPTSSSTLSTWSDAVANSRAGSMIDDMLSFFGLDQWSSASPSASGYHLTVGRSNGNANGNNNNPSVGNYYGKQQQYSGYHGGQQNGPSLSGTTEAAKQSIQSRYMPTTSITKSIVTLSFLSLALLMSSFLIVAFILTIRSRFKSRQQNRQRQQQQQQQMQLQQQYQHYGTNNRRLPEQSLLSDGGHAKINAGTDGKHKSEKDRNTLSDSSTDSSSGSSSFHTNSQDVSRDRDIKKIQITNSVDCMKGDNNDHQHTQYGSTQSADKQQLVDMMLGVRHHSSVKPMPNNAIGQHLAIGQEFRDLNQSDKQNMATLVHNCTNGDNTLSQTNSSTCYFHHVPSVYSGTPNDWPSNDPETSVSPMLNVNTIPETTPLAHHHHRTHHVDNVHSMIDANHAAVGRLNAMSSIGSSSCASSSTYDASSPSASTSMSVGQAPMDHHPLELDSNLNLAPNMCACQTQSTLNDTHQGSYAATPHELTSNGRPSNGYRVTFCRNHSILVTQLRNTNPDNGSQETATRAFDNANNNKRSSGIMKSSSSLSQFPSMGVNVTRYASTTNDNKQQQLFSNKGSGNGIVYGGTLGRHSAQLSQSTRHDVTIPHNVMTTTSPSEKFAQPDRPSISFVVDTDAPMQLPLPATLYDATYSGSSDAHLTTRMTTPCQYHYRSLDHQSSMQRAVDNFPDVNIDTDAKPIMLNDFLRATDETSASNPLGDTTDSVSSYPTGIMMSYRVDTENENKLNYAETDASYSPNAWSERAPQSEHNFTSSNNNSKRSGTKKKERTVVSTVARVPPQRRTACRVSLVAHDDSSARTRTISSDSFIDAKANQVSQNSRSNVSTGQSTLISPASSEASSNFLDSYQQQHQQQQGDANK